MMTPDEIEIVKIVYQRFLESEDQIWTDVDSTLEMFEYLTDDEIIVESEVKIGKHAKNGIRCSLQHDRIDCFSPYILEAAEAIVKLYNNTNQLHPKNRYILSYYLAMSEVGLIFPIDGP